MNPSNVHFKTHNWYTVLYIWHWMHVFVLIKVDRVIISGHKCCNPDKHGCVFYRYSRLSALNQTEKYEHDQNKQILQQFTHSGCWLVIKCLSANIQDHVYLCSKLVCYLSRQELVNFGIDNVYLWKLCMISVSGCDTETRCSFLLTTSLLQQDVHNKAAAEYIKWVNFSWFWCNKSFFSQSTVWSRQWTVMGWGVCTEAWALCCMAPYLKLLSGTATVHTCAHTNKHVVNVWMNSIFPIYLHASWWCQVCLLDVWN